MAKNNSRTTNTLFNFTSSVGGQLITTVMKFVVRTVFINTLGKQYLGIGGLFSNILSMLSLAELGVGSAILFKLYDPIAKDDKHRISILMQFYKFIYRVIGLVVFVLGISLIPFLPILINDYESLANLHINAIIIFLLYLSQSVSSYLFFAYKSAIIKANQKEYYINVIGYFFTIASSLLQIVLLLIVKNFELYVLVNIISTIGQNFVCAKLANKMYPYINEPLSDRISKQEVIDTFKDCGALMLYKLNDAVLKATDNIVLSAFRGLETVAMYANYYIFYTTIHTLIVKIFNSVSHSLGNLHTTHNNEHEYRIYESIMLICAILGGTAGVGIAVVSDEFVNVWVGHDWVLSFPFAILMGWEIYTMPFKTALSKYRTTMGLFRQGKYRPLAGMIINLVVSIALVKVWGICGVLVGTIVADWLTFMWFDPLVIHKYGFENYMPAVRHFRKFLTNFGVVVLIAFLDIFLCRRIFVGLGWISVIIHASICGITVPTSLVIVNLHTQEGQYVLNLIKNYYKKIIKKITKH